MEGSEYFVYCGLFIAKSWRKRSAQIAKGQFLEVAKEKEMTLDRVLSKQQSRVISVLSYYLTSLVNLSFCRFDPAILLALSPSHTVNCILFGEMAFCVAGPV